MRVLVLVFASLLLFPSDAAACTICNAGTGPEVRAGIFDGNFFQTLLVTAAPFPLFLAIVALIHLGPPTRKPPDA